MDGEHQGLAVPWADPILHALLTPPSDGRGGEHRAIAGTNLVMLGHFPTFKRGRGAQASADKGPRRSHYSGLL